MQRMKLSTKQTEIKEGGLYYLAHPATTYGDLEKNKASAKKIKEAIMESYGISIVNPLEIFTRDIPWDVAMSRCFGLILQTDGLILSPYWLKSKGCVKEALFAIEKNLPIYIVSGCDIIEHVTHELIAETIRKHSEEEKSIQLSPNCEYVFRISDDRHPVKKLSVIEKETGRTIQSVKVSHNSTIQVTTAKKKSPCQKLDDIVDSFLNTKSLNFHELARENEMPESLIGDRKLIFIGEQRQLGCVYLDEDDEIGTVFYLNNYSAALLGEILKNVTHFQEDLYHVDLDRYERNGVIVQSSAIPYVFKNGYNYINSSSCALYFRANKENNKPYAPNNIMDKAHYAALQIYDVKEDLPYKSLENFSGKAMVELVKRDESMRFTDFETHLLTEFLNAHYEREVHELLRQFG